MNAPRRLVIATALSICLAHPAGSHAAAPHAFYGVIAANDPSASEIARMGAGRVGTLRINLVWGAVQSGPQAGLNWSHYDELIGNAARAGIRVLPTVYSSPPWSAVRDYYPPSARTRTDFGNFVRTAAARYGSSGGFWAEHPDIPRLPIRDWQLWNEPNLQGFWLPKLSAKSYVSLLRVFSRAVRSGDRSGGVLLAGLFPNPTRHGGVIGIPLRRYLSSIYRRKKAKALFDGVAIHPYARTPHRALAWAKRTRRVMLQFNDRKTPIWLTEIGWTTGGDPSPLTVSPERQAAYLSRTFKLLAAKRVRYRIAGAVWFSWRDVPGRAWFNHTGLFTEAFEPKPSWNAFVGLTGGSPNSPTSSGLPIPLP
jgi:polysaccharide biosynthesis protein PslG